jgi:hypothetical protein
MMAILIAREKEDGQVGGLVPHLVEMVFLFFSMRMILFCSWNMI